MGALKNKDLDIRRKQASDLSLGVSHSLIYGQALDIVQTHCPKKAIFYDFGAGRGSFLKRASAVLQSLEVKELRGLDLMDRPQGLPVEVSWTQWDLNRDPPKSVHPADFIVSLEVIEHLENPRHFVRQMTRLLKPGGHLLLSTPNNHSFRALLSLYFRDHFVEFTGKSYPAHITALTSIDLLRITSEAGLGEPQFHFLKKGALPGLARWTWQQISFGFLQGKRFSDNLFLLVKKN